MRMTQEHTPPGLKSLASTWRNDLIAGLSVSLVALPLALGIALASGAPPMAGVISAVIGGVLTTFFRGTHIGINGPGNGLIVVLTSGAAALGGGEVFAHLLGAAAVAGGLQVAMGLLKLGRFGNLAPAAVVHGMLAAIGVIILAKQAHVALGVESAASSPLDALLTIPDSMALVNPFVLLISALGLAVLLIHPRIESKFIHFLPAPLLVLLIAVPLVYAFDFFSPHTIEVLGQGFEVGPHLLVSIPDDIMQSIVAPDFSRIGEVAFWQVVLTILLVTSIEDLVSAKATQKLDFYDRKVDLDRDLIGVGGSSIVSSFIGGLPVLTVIARSSVNCNHGAKTGWSNFVHGVGLALFVLLLAPFIRQLPFAALAAILVYTGAKLASPRVFREMLQRGPDQLMIFLFTLIMTLWLGLLWGVFLGIIFKLFYQFIHVRVRLIEFYRSLRNTQAELTHEDEKPYVVTMRGVANFLGQLKLKEKLDAVPKQETIVLDFSKTMMVDLTMLEFCHEYMRRYEMEGGQFDIIGLEAHRTFSPHPDSLHILDLPLSMRRLTQRQQELTLLAEEEGWVLDTRLDWNSQEIRKFHYFRTHPLEYRDMQLSGTFASRSIAFEVMDLTFDEGAIVAEVYHATVLRVHLPWRLPEFTLEKEALLDRMLELAGFQDIDFDHFTQFSRRFVLKGPEENAIRELLTPKRLRFFEAEDVVYHIESCGDELLVFKSLRLATVQEVRQLVDFGERLVAVLLEDAPQGS